MLTLLTLVLLANTSNPQIFTDPKRENERMEQIEQANELRNSCRKGVDDHLAIENLRYRAVVYGQISTRSAPIGTIHTDNALNSWQKVDRCEWKSVDFTQEFEDESGVGTERVLKPTTCEFDSALIGGVRNSLFAVRDLPSAIVPSLTQAMRAMECNMRSVCVRAAAKVSGTFAAEAAPGCRPIDNPFRVNELCDATGIEGSNDIAADMLTYCDDAVDQIVEREMALTTAAFEYHAAYTTLLQFAGNLDLFIAQWREPVTTTLWQAAELSQELSRFPCFLSSCDASPTNPK